MRFQSKTGMGPKHKRMLIWRAFNSFIFVMAVVLDSTIAEAINCELTFGNRTDPKAPLQRFTNTFGTQKPIIGMIHLAGFADKSVVGRALEELRLFEKHGVHAAIIENYHGLTYQVEMVLRAAQGRFPKLVLGVNILPNDYQLAFHWARKYGAKFIQLDFVSGNYLGNSNKVIRLDYFDYLKERSLHPDILVLGGVHPKYYEPLPGSDLVKDLRVAQWVADAVVVTGEGTGMATPLAKIQKFRNILGPNFPLVIGAGLSAENAREQLHFGDGAIVGSYFKDGETENPMNPKRIEEIKEIFDRMGGD